jgi:hypothetical protein
MFFGDDGNGRTSGDLRAAAKSRGRQLRRQRRLVVGGAISATLVIGVAVGVIAVSQGPSSSTVAVTAPTTESSNPTSKPTLTVPTGEAILALTNSGSLEELSYPSGRIIHEVASPDQVRRCFGPIEPGGCADTEPPLFGASLAYSQQTRTAYLSLGQEIDVYPLDGSPPSYLTSGWDPAVSPDGQTLAFQPEPGVEPGKAVVGLRDLATGTSRMVVIPAATVAAEAGLPLPNTVEDTVTTGLSWAPDSRHLAVTISMSFGLNAANTIGTTFFEVVILDTQEPLSATNPKLVGPLASSMTNLRSPSDGQGWNQAIWYPQANRLIVIHESPDLNDCIGTATEPMNLAVVDPQNGSSSTVQLAQPAHSGPITMWACPGKLLSIDPDGRLLLIGKGLPRLEEWNVKSAPSTLTLVATGVTAAAWTS